MPISFIFRILLQKKEVIVIKRVYTLALLLLVLTGCFRYSDVSRSAVNLYDWNAGLANVCTPSDSSCVLFFNKVDTASIWRVQTGTHEKQKTKHLTGWKFSPSLFGDAWVRLGSVQMGVLRNHEGFDERIFLYDLETDSFSIVPVTVEGISQWWLEENALHFICRHDGKKEATVDSRGYYSEVPRPDYGAAISISWSHSLGRCWIQYDIDSLFVGIPGTATRFPVAAPISLAPLHDGTMLIVSAPASDQVDLYTFNGQDITQVHSLSAQGSHYCTPLVYGQNVFVPVIRSASLLGVVYDGLFSIDSGRHWHFLALGTMRDIFSLTDQSLYFVGDAATIRMIDLNRVASKEKPSKRTGRKP